MSTGKFDLVLHLRYAAAAHMPVMFCEVGKSSDYSIPYQADDSAVEEAFPPTLAKGFGVDWLSASLPSLLAYSCAGAFPPASPA
ncbi:hypothetical protein KSP40_PGU005301 [Platanthera guangdongensis]|uniref:Uncharacterized protein n=1 Tax=Platanthera guangdongensis TaxID=2320717 RepID=A0ABR2LRV8_9ASPA